MKLLLDTHTFIWWASEPSKLSTQVLTLCQNPLNEVCLSVASVWEMQIKIQLGKMQIGHSLVDMIAQHQKTNRVQLLAINLAHVLILDSLPLYHRDPFDRLLIAQAIEEGATLLTRDAIFRNYPVQIRW